MVKTIIMKKTFLILLILLVSSCKKANKKELDAQQIIDKTIEVSGGIHYKNSTVSFDFRDIHYISDQIDGKKLLKRITTTDSLVITDIKAHNSFQRFFNDSLLILSDSISNRYANSVNSVHYFARLPYGLNDSAVNKELIGEVLINGNNYYKIKVTFNENDGGEDFDDVYIYWVNKITLKPDFLAYEFHVDGGGIRFREAYNERYINKIRFVDYKNYKANNKVVDIFEIDSLFNTESLELLSKIELKNIRVEALN